MDYRVTLIIALEALLALWLLYRAGCLKSPAWWSPTAALLLVAFVPRLLMMKYETLDYQNFLAPWVRYFRENGGFRALGQTMGNYNVPYMVFLALFSYSKIKDLYLIKLLSVFFDVMLAWSGLRIVSRVTDKPLAKLGVFFTLLMLPSVYLNGAVWGQCDSIYVALALLALADALDGRPWRSMAMLALSFSFKLQAIFIMPVFAVLLFAGKIQWKHLPVFPLTYVLAILPAVIAGRPFGKTLLFYASEFGTVGSSLNYNSSSIYAIFKNTANPDFAAKVGIFCAFVFMLLVLSVCFLYRKRLNDRLILLAAALFAIGIPFFLPHMHDRYFFTADAVTVILAFMLPILAPVAAFTQFASLLGYYAYLTKHFLLFMDHGARALILALAALVTVSVLELKNAAGAEKSGAESTDAPEKVLDKPE